MAVLQQLGLSFTLLRIHFHFLARFAVLGCVRALIEAGEQEVEHEGVGADKVREGNREVAVVLEEQLECMDHHHHELNLKRVKNE